MTETQTEERVGLETKGVIGRYEVTHSRSRGGFYQGSKTRFLVVVPEDIGDDIAALQHRECEVVVTMVPPEQRELPGQRSGQPMGKRRRGR